MLLDVGSDELVNLLVIFGKWRRVRSWFKFNFVFFLFDLMCGFI